MAKYEPLRRLLTEAKGPVTFTFREIEAAVGAGLPPTARSQVMWWDNDSPQHTQANSGWLAAGLEVRAVDLDREVVTFRRSKEGAAASPP